VTFGSGAELWRLPVPLTASYSRDCDGSSFYLGGRAYLGVESGLFYVFDPLRTVAWNGYRRPVVIESRQLLGDAGTRAAHAGNLVLEASPALLKDRIYISSGSGFVYGMRRDDLRIVWAYRTGSDLDGTAVPTADGMLLVPVEKQYITGHGGVLMLDPSKPPDRSRVWFFPTGDRKYSDWLGGVIGSVAVNDSYNAYGRHPSLAAFNAIDGNLYVVAQDAFAKQRVPGPDNEPRLRTPVQVFKAPIGGGISTPVMVDDGIVAAGYDGIVHLYRITYSNSRKGRPGALKSPDGKWWKVRVKETSRYGGGGSFESTPICWDGRIYIGSRSGWFYCLGTR
jgi:outer membrane protein assembly factor BamB